MRLAAPLRHAVFSGHGALFTWSIETYGQYGCTLSAGATVFGMTVQEAGLGLLVMSNVVAVNTSLPDEEGPTLTLDDETLQVNLSFFNAGRRRSPSTGPLLRSAEWETFRLNWGKESSCWIRRLNLPPKWWPLCQLAAPPRGI